MRPPTGCVPRALWLLRLLNDKMIRENLPELLAERPSSRLFLWEVAKTVVALRPARVTPVMQDMLREEESSSREIAVCGFSVLSVATCRAVRSKKRWQKTMTPRFALRLPNHSARSEASNPFRRLSTHFVIGARVFGTLQRMRWPRSAIHLPSRPFASG